jgi:hypothetical protein
MFSVARDHSPQVLWSGHKGIVGLACQPAQARVEIKEAADGLLSSGIQPSLQHLPVA